VRAAHIEGFLSLADAAALLRWLLGLLQTAGVGELFIGNVFVLKMGPHVLLLKCFLKLGVTCFGGPIAHIGYFREEFVVRRRWLDEQAYADLVGLCQFLPGPASSQVGFSIGLMRAGYRGGLAAWTGFTLPSAIALVLFAYGAGALGGPIGVGLLHGLKQNELRNDGGTEFPIFSKLGLSSAFGPSHDWTKAT
jgi:hypothetical protein